MFKKILVANRGEIAVRIIRTCHEMGITSVAVYEPEEQNSLHLRLADQCLPLTTTLGYRDANEVLRLARESGADAIHPGYGFLAEQPEFAQICEAAGVAFIGPSSELIATFQNKIGVLEKVRNAGYRTPHHSDRSTGDNEAELLQSMAGQMHYPLLVKSCSGGRGRGTRLITESSMLAESARQARREAENVFGDRRIYLEEAITPARHLEVQILADNYGHLIHLGERDGSVQRNNQKLIEESPSPNLTPAQREELRQTALDIARLFNYRNAGTVEFLMDDAGRFYFTEMKARIQVDHPVTEMVSMVDIVREQIRIAADEPLRLQQADVQLKGWAMLCRINAEDPWNNFLPSPGVLSRFHVPGGAHIRVDSYGCTGCAVPVEYDPTLAKVTVWGETRAECLSRLGRALDEFTVQGVRTNLTLLRQVLTNPQFVRGEYHTDLLSGPLPTNPIADTELRDLAAAAAVAYVIRTQAGKPSLPERLLSGWHRSSRTI